jgi:N-dimethylarginine dimethylaminohydrolase
MGYILSAPQPPTGEQFLMREPATLSRLVNPGAATVNYHWKSLRYAMEQAGAEVVADTSRSTFLVTGRHSMYPRDPGLMLQVGDRRFYVTPDEPGMAARREAKEIANLLGQRQLATHVTAPGQFDGGDIVQDAANNLLFVGVSNHHFMKKIVPSMQEWLSMLAKQQGTELPEHFDPRDYVDGDKLNHYHKEVVRHAQPKRQWLEHVRDRWAPEPLLAREGRGLRIVPLFIPDTHSTEFYHLDGVFNVLPTGEAVVCEEALGKAARHLIHKYIGEDRILPVTIDEARRGATNFITVGKTIITPYANPHMQEWFGGLGYDVVDPKAVGLPDWAWNFGHGAGPRCATLKLTPDKAHPPVLPRPGIEQQR